MKYSSLSLVEIEVFKEMFSTFQDLILAMISNSVRVLPSDKSVFRPNLKMHLDFVKKSAKHNCKYEEFVDIKDVFLSCVPNQLCRKNLDSAILHFKIDDKRKIRFSIKKKFYSCLDNSSRLSFNKDIDTLELIINNINDNFNKRLPLALQSGRLISCKIHSVDIPRKAKYIKSTRS